MFGSNDPLHLRRETSAATLWRDLQSHERSRDTLSPEDLTGFHEWLRSERARQNIAAMSDFDGIETFLPEVSECSVSDLDTSVWGLIVETRPHPNLAFVVGQVCDLLGIRVQLVHGPENRTFIESSDMASRIADGQVVLTELRNSALTEHRYNAMFMCRTFWNHVIGRRKILVFQTDAILCPQSPYRIEDFMRFDYIGSAWGRCVQWGGLSCDGGNGGFSLRDWGRSVECLERFPPNGVWPSAEDKFFSFHMELIGAAVAGPIDSAKFGSEKWFLYPSFGAHQITRMNNIHLGQFLRYCPEARRISGDRVPDRNRYRCLRANVRRYLMRRALNRLDQIETAR